MSSTRRPRSSRKAGDLARLTPGARLSGGMIKATFGDQKENTAIFLTTTFRVDARRVGPYVGVRGCGKPVDNLRRCSRTPDPRMTRLDRKIGHTKMCSRFFFSTTRREQYIGQGDLPKQPNPPTSKTRWRHKLLLARFPYRARRPVLCFPTSKSLLALQSAPGLWYISPRSFQHSWEPSMGRSRRCPF